MDVNEIIGELQELATTDHFNKLSHFGIPSNNALGVKLPDIRKTAKRIGINQNFWFQIMEIRHS